MYTNFATNLETHFIEYLSSALEELQKATLKEIIVLIGPRKVGKTFISLYLKGEQFDKINDEFYSKLELKIPNQQLPPINNMNSSTQHPFQVVQAQEYTVIDLTGFNGKDFEINTFINCQIVKRLKKQMRILLVIDEPFLKNKIDEKAFLKYLEYSLGINEDLLQLRFGIVINKVKDLFKKKEEQLEINIVDIRNYLLKRLGLHAKYEFLDKQDYFQDFKDKQRFFSLFKGDIFTIMHTDKQFPSKLQLQEFKQFVDNLYINNLNEFTIQENPSLTNLFQILLKKYSEQTQDRILSKMSRQRKFIKELCSSSKISDDVYNQLLKKYLYYITENKQINRLKVIQKISQLNPGVKLQIDQNVKSCIKQYTDTFSVHQEQILARLEQNNQDVQKKINKLKQINNDLEQVKQFILQLLKQVPKAPQIQEETSEAVIVKKLVQTNQLISKFALNFSEYQEIIQIYKSKLRDHHYNFNVVNKLQRYFHKILCVCINDFDYELNKNDYAIQDQWKNYENAQMIYKEHTLQIKPQAAQQLEIIMLLLEKFKFLQEAEAIYSCLNYSEQNDLRQIVMYIKELRNVFMEQVNEDYNNKMKVENQFKEYEPKVKYQDQQ